jgi:cytochrome c peroxidase
MPQRAGDPTALGSERPHEKGNAQRRGNHNANRAESSTASVRWLPKPHHANRQAGLGLRYEIHAIKLTKEPRMLSFAGNSKRSLLEIFRRSTEAAVVLCVAGVVAPGAAAQDSLLDPGNQAWQAGAIEHAQAMRSFIDPVSGQQPTPPVIPTFLINFDQTGIIATAQPGGSTKTSQSAFFGNLGTNNRTCFSCHQPQDGWGVSAASVQARYRASYGNDPIFRLVDGATCPSADVSNVAAKQRAYSLLLSKGLIRIGLPVPATAEYQIVSVTDPYGCNTNPVTGLTNFGPSGPTTGIVSVYRRPLPSTNLGFLTTIMWDGREPSLTQQAIDATLIHAQGNAAPTALQQQQIVAFESGIFTAQAFDDDAQYLSAAGATGGPEALANLLSGFFIGINDPLGGNPQGLPFTSQIFDLYQAWNGIKGRGGVNAAREAVARGEALFNNTPITITGVAGINDLPGLTTVSGFCGTCHDSPNVGNHSVKLPINIGIANAGPDNDNAGLDIGDLPEFTLLCVSGPNIGKSYTVTDPGKALISGKCADIGKVKGPILRGLAGRAPYFHNGSAATLLDAVNFYNLRFNIGLTPAQMSDLAAFLQTL